MCSRGIYPTAAAASRASCICAAALPCGPGNLLKAAEVFKGLLQLHVDKPLSFREKKMLDRARHMLVEEISIALSVPEITAESLLQRSLSKAGLKLPAIM